MEYFGHVDPKMIDALRGANTMVLDIDGGDKEFKLNTHFDQMIEIGAMIVGCTNASTVRIIAFNDDNNKRVIDFYPKSGNYDLEVDEWEDTRMAETSLEITDPEHEELWKAINLYDLLFRKETRRGWTWTFTGTVSNLEKFVKEYYFNGDIESAEEHLEDGGLIILND